MFRAEHLCMQEWLYIFICTTAVKRLELLELRDSGITVVTRDYSLFRRQAACGEPDLRGAEIPWDH
jgi:hypothetical protein